MPIATTAEGQTKPEQKTSIISYAILLVFIYYLFAWLYHNFFDGNQPPAPPPAPQVTQSPTPNTVQNMSPVAPIEKMVNEAPFSERKEEIQALLKTIFASTEVADGAIENGGVGAYKFANAGVKIDETLNTLGKIVIPDNLEADDEENLKDAVQGLLDGYGKKKEAMNSMIRAVARNDTEEALTGKGFIEEGNALSMAGLHKIVIVAKKYGITME